MVMCGNTNQGDTGFQGTGFQDTGFQGTQGSRSNLLIQTFVHGDRITQQTLAPQDRIIFDAPTAISIGNAMHPYNSSHFYLWESGYYQVTFIVYHNDPCQFSLFMNDSVIPATTCSSTNTQLILTTIIYISLSDVSITPTEFSPSGFAADIEVVNHSMVTLNSNSGSKELVASFSAILLLPTLV